MLLPLHAQCAQMGSARKPRDQGEYKKHLDRVQSLRQSSAQMHRTLRAWLAGVVSYDDGDSELLHGMHLLLGVEDDWMPFFMELQFRFEPNRVTVALDLEGAADVPDQSYVRSRASGGSHAGQNLAGAVWG